MLLLVHFNHKLIQQQWVNSLYTLFKTVSDQTCWSYLKFIYTLQDSVQSNAVQNLNEHSLKQSVCCPSAAQFDVADLNRYSVQINFTAVQTWLYHYTLMQIQTSTVKPVQWFSVMF